MGRVQVNPFINRSEFLTCLGKWFEFRGADRLYKQVDPNLARPDSIASPNYNPVYLVHHTIQASTPG